MGKIVVRDTEINVTRIHDEDYICPTDMLNVSLFGMTAKQENGVKITVVTLDPEGYPEDWLYKVHVPPIHQSKSQMLRNNHEFLQRTATHQKWCFSPSCLFYPEDNGFPSNDSNLLYQTK